MRKPRPLVMAIDPESFDEPVKDYDFASLGDASSLIDQMATAGGFGFLGALFPVLFNVLFIGFEIFIAVIQAYVFGLLTCIYLKDTIELHH